METSYTPHSKLPIRTKRSDPLNRKESTLQIKKSFLEQMSAITNLPTLPHILVKLIKTCNQDKGSLKEISRIVEKDPSLAGKVLRLVNSAYYGLPRKVGNVEQAVTYLGTETVKNTAICASVLGVFHQAKGDSVFNMKLFWRHSLKCALLARLIATKIRYGDPDEAFLSGLLHDIGRLVLYTNYKSDYSDLLEMYRDRPDLLMAGETRLGGTHAEIGAWLLARWKFPSFLADSILYHHEPINRILSALPLVQIIYTANALSGDTEKLSDLGLKVAKDTFRIAPEEMGRLISRAEEELGEVAASLDIEIGRPGERLPHLSEKDLRKQEDLSHEVRNASLLLGTLRNLLAAEDETAILQELYRGLQILFDLKTIHFFLHDTQKEGLVGRPIPAAPGSELMENLIIPMGMENSLLIRCMRQGTPVESFRRQTAVESAVIDEQLLHFMDAEGLFCQPLIAYGTNVGLILIGFNEEEYVSFSKESKLLDMLAREAAVALHVHALKQSRLKSVQEERLLASSEMARKVVHEVNNPLGIIKNYLKILAMKISEKDGPRDEIRIINEEIDRVASILGELTEFSKNRVHQKEAVDVNALLSDLVTISKESLIQDSGIEVRMDLEPSLPSASADRNSLKQVFFNLIKNAVEAMSAGGILSIKTRHLSSRLKGETMLSHQQGEYVEVSISDTGPGIPEEIQSRIFDPYVSSKGGRNEGLGLSIVHSIIKALHGHISCESEKDKGTTFRIDLPTVPK
jgi:HD-like signal output (HDOD) protein/signal transduction histidine kinase